MAFRKRQILIVGPVYLALVSTDCLRPSHAICCSLLDKQRGTSWSSELSLLQSPVTLVYRTSFI